MLQAVAFQMTFVGAPMIYYGNEAGMFSPDDPSNRMPMWWKDLEPFDNPDFRFDDRVFEFHQRAAAIRNAKPALRTGSFRPVKVSDEKNVYAFAREQDGESVYVVLNRSDTNVTINLPVTDPSTPLFDYLDESTAAVSFDASQPTARPTIAVKPGASPVTIADGQAVVRLEPYSTAVLAP